MLSELSKKKLSYLLSNSVTDADCQINFSEYFLVNRGLLILFYTIMQCMRGFSYMPQKLLEPTELKVSSKQARKKK